MYQSSIHFERTAAEKQDCELSWQRPDRAFFAAGACHILAFVMKEKVIDSFEIIFIKPAKLFGSTGTHVYVSNGEWSFDFNGWTKEAELLTAVETDYTAACPGWSFERVIIDTDLETFCQEHSHTLPTEFADDPITRASSYLGNFELKPPIEI